MTSSQFARRFVLSFGLVALLAARAAAFNQIVAFGDSLTDVGNVSNATFGISPGSSYYQGRYSNGPLWVENFASGIGAANLNFSRNGGSDWAYGGAHTGPGSITHIFFTFPNVQTQINNYLGSNTPNANQLFVVWAGGNDFIDGQTNASVPVTNTATEITTLANAGVTNIVVPNLPLLGEVPRFRGTANQATMNSRSSQFNSQLATTLANLKSSLNINIYQLDVQSFFTDVIANPGAYGFTNVTNPALSGSTVVPNPDQYLFWDDIHPTRVGHSLLAQRAVDLMNTHNWIAAGSAAWGTAGNWDPSGAPASAWIVNLSNSSALDETCAISTSSTVSRITVSASGARMALKVNPGASLVATASVVINSGGVVELAGGSLTAGSMSLASGGVIQLDLAAADIAAPAKLNVASQAMLAGAMAIATRPGFIPLPGDTFNAISFGSRTGDVSIVNDTGFAGLRFNKIYSAAGLTLATWALDGDANLDAVADTTDFNILATNFGATGGNWLDADFNGDTSVDTLDFNILASSFGDTTPPQLGALVPEPATAAFAMLLLLFSRISRPQTRAN